MADKTKLLNLDEFVPNTKVLTHKGIQHEMRELTVAEYLAKVAEAKKTDEAAKNAELTIDQQVEKTVEMIAEAFPSFPKDDLYGFNLQKLTVILNFVIEAPEDIAAKAAAGNA